jgi:uncharacterized protein (TIGR04255 family)
LREIYSQHQTVPLAHTLLTIYHTCYCYYRKVRFPAVFSIPKLRRIWFESADKRQLIQLQANRFHYNWRRQNELDKYPHFEEIYPTFEQEWKIFQDWWLELGGLPLQAMRYQMTYLNQIDKAFGWNNSGDTSRIFTLRLFWSYGYKQT